MWDTLTGWLYIYGKIIVVLYLTGLALFLYMPYATRKAIYRLMNKRIRDFSFANSDYIWPKLSFEAEVILKNIIIQMTELVDEHKENVKKHAMNQHNLLYCCQFWLPLTVHNEDLWKAMDYVKQLFYAMHGVYLQKGGGDRRRNNIDLRLILDDGSVVDEMSLAQARLITGNSYMTMKQFLKLQYPDSKEGVVLQIHMSIVTSMTSKVYDYRQHAEALSH